MAGRRPDGFPLYAVYTEDWLAHCALRNNVIAQFGNERMGEARVRFAKLINQRVRKIIGMVPLDDIWEFHTWVSRKNGEAYAYVKKLGKLRTSRWCGIRGVRQEALCF